ncbi:hypothetical protein [Larkinella rosea]|uniref:Ada DNA repair metal-binding domain-containing protein n=1 Tax=Larkinella rosea TaxID=2025312 RepID=A0A3P1C3J9_9BACT|nr:hypothetical protein [Larkinella rosea]RRB07867.1 hypothetical protein EHT25_08850 [Larkinella rosea]
MKSRFTLLFLLVWTLAFGQVPSTYQPQKQKRKAKAVPTVLICQSRSAYAYHQYECHGLARCRSPIARVTVAQARSMGYVPCKNCY